MSRVLVVYYSRSGTTRGVARELAAVLDADVEELHDHVDRTGSLGYLRTVVESVLETSTELDLPRNDPARYDLVVLGSPVFAGGVSAAIRTYAWLHREHLPRVALFVTYGGSWADRALAQLAALTGKRPVATLAIRQAHALGHEREQRLAPFVRALRSTLRRAPARRRAAG